FTDGTVFESDNLTGQTLGIWSLQETYDGVSINAETGIMTTGGNAENSYTGAVGVILTSSAAPAWPNGETAEITIEITNAIVDSEVVISSDMTDNEAIAGRDVQLTATVTLSDGSIFESTGGGELSFLGEWTLDNTYPGASLNIATGVLTTDDAGIDYYQGNIGIILTSTSGPAWPTGSIAEADILILPRGVTRPELDLMVANEDIDKLEAAQTYLVTDMSNLFRDTTINPNISDWDTSSVATMEEMFKRSQFTGDISDWDTSSVTNMRWMFGQSQFNGDISGWDTSSVTNMSNLFQGTIMTSNISDWDTSSVTNMEAMFEASTFNGDISGWDTSSATHMFQMFNNNTEFDIDLSGWSVNNVIYYNAFAPNLRSEYWPLFN
ncbi:BspA family leucine-rich repeat surface protein, partial [Aliivibrio salmonicida]|uniref:BspA family leucine-rich repeat surface protein n=1 Tax=Aliivibrio salmonicida TaxID=40269 RepID=UPI003D1400A8